MSDVPPEPEPSREPVVPIHLPRAEDPASRRSRRLAGLVSAAVHGIVVVLLLLLPGLLPELPRRSARVQPEEQRIPVTFQEFRPPPPAPPRAPRGEPNAPLRLPAPAAPQAPDRRPPGAAPRAPRGEDQGRAPGTGGSVLPPEEGPAARPAPSSRPGTRPFDVDQALRDFRRQIPPAQEGPATGSARSGAGSGRGLPSLPSTGFSAGNLEFESRDYDWTDYYRQIHLAIWQAWHRRLHQTTERFERFAHARGDWLLEDSARIRFTILRSGQVVDVGVELPSGCPPLDDSAVDALREVVLPPLPSDFPRGSETVRGRFIATGDIRGMRRTLEYLHARGAF